MKITKDIKQKLKEIEVVLEKTKTLEELKQIKAKVIFKSTFFLNFKKILSKEKNSLKKIELGKQFNFFITKANELILKTNERIISETSKKINGNPLLKNLNLNSISITQNKKGKLNFLTEIQLQVFSFFENLNFEYFHGHEVETEEINFEALNIPQNHPARKLQDTFYLTDKNLLLRTHSTNTTARKLLVSKYNDISSYSIGTVFRNDDNDSTHSFQFNQIDFFSLTKNANISTLKYVINSLINFLFKEKLKTRYRISFFPFTEPSIEVDIECRNCKQKGCNICSMSGWIEILGCGMLSPKVLEFTGKNIENVNGFAAGIGVERIAMLKYNITDIREFYTNKVN